MLILKIAIGVALGIGLTKMTRYDWRKLALFLLLLVALFVGVLVPILAFQLQRGVNVPLTWKFTGIAVWCAVLWGITFVVNRLGRSMTD